jgi:hypothetical protein
MKEMEGKEEEREGERMGCRWEEKEEEIGMTGQWKEGKK